MSRGRWKNHEVGLAEREPDAEPDPPPSVESEVLEELEGAETPEPTEEFSPETFLLMDDAPRDGSMIQVKMDPDAPDEAAHYAVWRSTTMFDKELRKWRRIGYWADPVTKRQLDGEPIVWRLASAAPLLGLIT